MLILLKSILLINLDKNENEVDCTWASWNSWSICTKACGGGTRTKNRTKSVTEAYGGACQGNATETQVCNEQKCPGKIASYLFDTNCIDIVYVIFCLKSSSEY